MARITFTIEDTPDGNASTGIDFGEGIWASDPASWSRAELLAMTLFYILTEGVGGEIVRLQGKEGETREEADAAPLRDLPLAPRGPRGPVSI